MWRDNDALVAFRPALARLADQGLSNRIQDFDALDQGTIRPDLHDAVRAAVLARDHIDVAPQASWILSALALLVWDRTLDPEIVAPWTHKDNFEAWRHLPQVFAATSLAVQATVAAANVLSLSTPMLWVARTWGMWDELQVALDQQAALTHKAATTIEQLVTELVEDLRAACEPGRPDGLRPHLAALLWTLGLVPESSTLQADGPLPPRALCKAAVRESIQTIGVDVLTQAVWFSMQSRSNIAAKHEELFALLLAPYASAGPLWGTAGRLGLDPYTVAQALVATCAGDLPPGAAAVPFDERCSRLLAIGGQDSPVDRLRLAMLRLLMRERTATVAAASSDSPIATLPPLRTDACTRLAGAALETGEAAYERAAPFSRAFGIPTFGLIDETMSRQPTEADALEVLVDRLEALRAIPVRRVLAAVPQLPPVSAGEGETEIERLLTEREDTIAHLRAAYVITELPKLPLYYRFAAPHQSGRWGGLTAELSKVAVYDDFAARHSSSPEAMTISDNRKAARSVLADETRHVQDLDARLGHLVGLPPPVDKASSLDRLTSALAAHTHRRVKTG
jgi:hypothetical protein